MADCDWSDYRPAFDSATGNNVRLQTTGNTATIQFKTWTSSSYTTVLTGCFVLPSGLMAIVALLWAPIAVGLAMLTVMVLVVFYLSTMVKTSIDPLQRSIKHETLFRGYLLFKTEFAFGKNAILRLFEGYDSYNLQLGLRDGKHFHQILVFQSDAEAYRFSKTLSDFLGIPLSIDR